MAAQKNDTDKNKAPDTQAKRPEQAAATTTKRKKVAALRVSSRPASFRRAGFEFSRTPRDLVLEELSEAQIRQLNNEPLLSVHEVEIEVEAK